MIVGKAANLPKLKVEVNPTRSISAFFGNPLDAYAYFKVDSDGGLDKYESFTAPGTYTFIETWLEIGKNTQVWIERTIVSGTLSVDAGSGRLAMTSDRVFGVSRTAIGIKTCTIDIDFYDAASGGNLLDSVRVTMTAEVDSGL